MKQELMSKDEQKINATLSCLEQGLVLMNNAKIAFDALGLRDLQDADLIKLENGESFIKDVLLEEIKNPEVQGVKISVGKLRDIVEMPTNSNEFILAAKEIIEHLQYNRREGFSTKFYSISKGEIVLSQKEIDKMIESYSFYAKTKIEFDFLEMAKKLRDVANETVKFNNTYGLFQKHFLHENVLLKFDSHEHTYSVNGSYILNLARNRQ